MNQQCSINDVLKDLEEQRNQNALLNVSVADLPERTLLLMGPTRAGKSTIVHVLGNSLYQPEEPTLYSVTRKPENQQIGGLTVIDMPGFNDLQAENPTLNNDSILRMLKEQICRYQPVDLFAFVFNFRGGIRSEDLTTMTYVRSKFPELAGRVLLMITHAEELNDRAKEKLSEDFFNHQLVKEKRLKEFFQDEIFFFGCLRYESLQREDKRALTNELGHVLKMRKKFIDKCFARLPSPRLQEQKRSMYDYLTIRNICLSLFTILLLTIVIGNAFIGHSDDRTSEQDKQIDEINHSNYQLALNHTGSSVENKQVSVHTNSTLENEQASSYEKSVDKGENDAKESSSLSKTDSDRIQILTQRIDKLSNDVEELTKSNKEMADRMSRMEKSMEQMLKEIKKP